MKPGTLLIVADNASVRENLLECASEVTPETWVAKDGHEAILFLEMDTIDAVVCCLSDSSDGMTCLELLAHARARKLDIPFVILSESIPVEAIKMGSIAYVQTPYLRIETSDAIQKALARSQQVRPIVSQDVNARRKVELRRIRHATQMLRRYSKIYSNAG